MVDGRTRATFDVATCGLLCLSKEGEVLAVNRPAATILGAGSVEAVTKDYLRTACPWLRRLDSGSTSGTVAPPDGTPRRVSAHAASYEDEVVLSLVDHSTPDSVDGVDAALLEWYRSVLDRSGDVICVFDRAGQLQWASRDAFGFARGTKVGASFADFVHPDDLPGLIDAFLAVLGGEQEQASLELRISTQDDDGARAWRHVDVVATDFLDDERVGGIVASIRDVTERAEARERLEWIAFHDALTGLPNRSVLFDRLAQAVANSQRRTTEVAVLFVDVDRFKHLNDAHGHLAGDAVLQAVAERLRRVARAEDTVARIGGDEFVVVCDNVEDPDAPADLADRILSAVGRPVRLEHVQVPLQVSIGVAVSSGGSWERLLDDADAALYRAKASGRGRVVVHDPADPGLRHLDRS